MWCGLYMGLRLLGDGDEGKRGAPRLIAILIAGDVLIILIELKVIVQDDFEGRDHLPVGSRIHVERASVGDSLLFEFRTTVTVSLLIFFSSITRPQDSASPLIRSARCTGVESLGMLQGHRGLG